MSIETTHEGRPKQKAVRGVPVATAIEVLTQALYYLAPHFTIATTNDDEGEGGALVIRIRGIRRDVVNGVTTFMASTAREREGDARS